MDKVFCLSFDDLLEHIEKSYESYFIYVEFTFFFLTLLFRKLPANERIEARELLFSLLLFMLVLF